ncbi:protein-L-isoaspartate(D-aspartate) O-methyltransferase [Sulfuricella denitrificans skB26]|uniref:Protein-L-isoaspartate O-methyltransferase n=1 Tax=Sulfuricella denitrificans (strain DSM 22764 / NBRC 105220 / skB26) TaxID=1163617 RepID=S6ADT8_SULDS|nr:protein-L-isoaspartate O-methyltransferase [Sulfuricella denitrificans]BAN36718.1 protein-L-isoaspartate(D-aspartate) O-methyltransferase [Sulfuricella denitrificans skB26]
MDIERARFNMVEQQIRPWDVLDQDVLDLLRQIRREDFVPEQYRELAFSDMEIPLGHGEAMLSPKFEAKILQEVGVKSTDQVLEVGTGSGYLTALLARMAHGGSVHSVEIVPEFSSQAAAMLKQHGIANITLEVGDAARGWKQAGPYDVIVLTGSVPVLPEAFQADLKVGGRLFAVVGESPVMEAQLITCVAKGVYRTTNLFETSVPPLKNAMQPQRFVF